MKKRVLFLLLILLTSVSQIQAQCTLVPVSLATRVQSASLIIEEKSGTIMEFLGCREQTDLYGP